MTNSAKRASRLTEIPDHLLAEIFLRLSAPADLARASAACVSFRQIVNNRAFIRRFRRIHAPPFVGFLDHDGFHPTQPPHPSAPTARTLTLAADFSFSFLPSHCRWTVQDTRDGRVLLKSNLDAQELVVCDPLHRRYILLPPLPDDLTYSLEKYRCRPFLVPIREEETAAAQDTTFRVIWMAHCKTKLAAFVFSSSTGQWRAAASTPWTDLVVDKGESDKMSQAHPIFLRRHYSYGCFYWDWLFMKSDKLLVLDTRKMEFSMAHIPPGDWSTIAIVEAREGRLGIFGFHGGITTSDLSYAIAQSKGKRPSQWQMEQTVSLDSGYGYYIRDATQRYLLLTRTERSYPENRLIEYFSMDVKTLQLQKVYAKQSRMLSGTRIYTNFALSLLSSPTI